MYIYIYIIFINLHCTSPENPPTRKMRDIGAQNSNWCFSWCQTHFFLCISGSAEVLPIPLDREIWSSQRPCDAGVGGESGGARHFQRFHQVTHNSGCLPTRVTTRGNRRESIPLEDFRGNAGETSPSLQMGLNYGRCENHYSFITCRWFFPMDLCHVQVLECNDWAPKNGSFLDCFLRSPKILRVHQYRMIQ